MKEVKKGIEWGVHMCIKICLYHSFHMYMSIYDYIYIYVMHFNALKLSIWLPTWGSCTCCWTHRILLARDTLTSCWMDFCCKLPKHVFMFLKFIFNQTWLAEHPGFEDLVLADFTNKPPLIRGFHGLSHHVPMILLCQPQFPRDLPRFPLHVPMNLNFIFQRLHSPLPQPQPEQAGYPLVISDDYNFEPPRQRSVGL